MAYPHHLLNCPFGDTTFTKVFVGGLAWETKSETLRRHFEQYGDIFEAVVISDKNTGRSKGYGFVTFRDPESARRACADPSPVIDGRQANCNLASLGRPRPAIPYAQLRPPGPYFGSMLAPRGAYVGSSSFQTVPYSYNQAALYSPYRYPAYGPEYVFPQNVQNSYMGHQYFQVYTVPYGQLGQQIPAVQSYSVPGHHFVQLGGQNIDEVTASPRPSIQAPYPSAAVPARPQFIVPAQSPQFTQGSGSD